jgi:hypothetical protein
VTVSRDGKRLASGALTERSRYGTSRPCKERKTFPAHQRGVNGLTFSPDGKTLASSARVPSADGAAVSFWDVASILGPPGPVELLPRHLLVGVRGRVLGIAFSPNGRLLATGGGAYGQFGELKFWDPVDGRLLGGQELPKSVDSLAFSPDGAILATAAGVEKEKGGLLLWKVAVRMPK